MDKLRLLELLEDIFKMIDEDSADVYNIEERLEAEKKALIRYLSQW